jgi:Lon protease-like protein
MNPLPLFPLNTVLFPGQLLPLRIFEERYCQMIGECLQTGAPFGVVLMRDGGARTWGAGAADSYAVGTTAHIVQAERRPAGRLNILCVGNARFRIQHTYHDRPYLRGAVDLWPWQPLDGAAQHLPLQVVRARLKRYIDWLAYITQREVEVELPQEAAALTNLAAGILQISAAEKQALLTTASIGELLDRIAALLQHELRDLHILYAARAPRPPAADDSGPFSLN